ncbi:cell division protein FtsX [Gottschalkia purinilytica]|uniref:Cell division protein FtsX n=1 Tax=Gottschalkia purinilytica TaxID=1503 RepID=A0A0L0WCM3_GOTPU|nr:permease-like cell division protein FtsX [Gottschalkia purinilytica]KNF09165.1 cell division protein FtsX [Gottschalkia purinilytica]
MAMMLRMFLSMLKSSFTSIWRNRTMSIASIGSVAATLVILGMTLILILNINGITNTTKDQFDKIQVYVKDGLKQEDIDKVQQDIKNIDGVAETTFQSKSQALKSMEREWKEQAYLLDGLEKENPLPNSFMVTLDNMEESDSVAKQLEKINGIEDIKYYRDIVEKLMSVASFVRLGGLILIAILVFVSVFIISNTVKITVTARRKEIGIMKYVGATNGFIRGPFILEGVLLGLIGTLFSILVVFYGYKYLFSFINERLYVILTVYMIAPEKLFGDISIMFVAIGVGIGMLGSIVSLRKFLRV